jgi:hypothetical protein
MLIGVGTSAGATTAAAAPSVKSAQALAAAKQAVKQFMSGPHTNQQVLGHTKKISALTQVQSNNWSGYADTGSGFTKVSASWTEPTPSCSGSSGSDLLAAFWVGIDGYSSSSVEQDGTMIECYYGTAYQYSWWEMYPSNSVQIVGQTVAAGDKITASVTRSGTTYTLKVTDSTHTANSLTKTQSGSFADSSAEWIAEAPSGATGVYPLAKFSTWTASSDAVSTSSKAGNISSFTDDEITMVDGSGRV